MASKKNPLKNWGTRGITSRVSNDPNQNTLPQGSVLQARYEVMKELGVGGMGAVYLAQDLRFTGTVRRCAIKEMIIATPDPQTRRLAAQNFDREATLLAQLNHPGIPKIYDFFTEANRSYLVMEYVDGKNLEAILDNTDGMLKEEVVLDWAIQICDVLTFIHAQKPPIIFRDLKPANIMLRQQNRIALIDFGIAKTFEAGQKGTMIGTEGYSPPEQYQGVASPKVDIYALGATLHHLLTKRDPRLEPPFTFHEAVPNSLNSNISGDTSAVIMKALEYKADNRYPTALAFKDAITKAIDKIPDADSDSPMATQLLSESSSSEPSSPPQTQQPQPGYPPPGYQYPPPGYQYPPPGYQYPPPGYPAPPGYPPQPDEAAAETVEPIWKFKCEDEVRASPASDGKNLYIGAYDNNLYALNLKTGEFQWKYATDGGIATRPTVSKDRIVFGSEDRIMYAISNRGRLIWTCPTEGRIRSSPMMEFERVFFGSDDGRFYAINAQNGRPAWSYEAMGPIRSSPALGGDHLFVGVEDGTLLALDIRAGSEKWKFRAKRAVTSSPTVYAKKDVVIVGSNDRLIYGLNAKNGYELWQVRTKQAVISSPSLYEDTIYIGGIDKNLYAIHANTGKQLWKFDAKSQIVSTPAVTEEAIYFGTSDGDVLCIGRADHKIRWRFKTQGAVPSSPLVIDDVVYIGSTDFHVYALPA